MHGPIELEPLVSPALTEEDIDGVLLRGGDYKGLVGEITVYTAGTAYWLHRGNPSRCTVSPFTHMKPLPARMRRQSSGWFQPA